MAPQATTDVQPADMGINKCLVAEIEKLFDEWLMTHPHVTFDPAYFNAIFVTAWNRVKGRLAPIIQRAWSSSGLYPLRHPEDGTVVADRTQSHNPTLSLREAVSPEQTCGLLRPARSADGELTLMRARTANPDKALVVREAALHVLEQGFIKPAEVLVEQRHHVTAKKTRVSQDQCRTNPSTRQGLFVSEEVLAEAQAVATARAAEQSRKAETRARTLLRKAQREQEVQAEGPSLLQRVRDGDLAKLKAPELKTLYTYLTGAPARGNKPDVFAAVARALERHQASPVGPQAAPLDDGVAGAPSEGLQAGGSADEDEEDMMDCVVVV